MIAVMKVPFDWKWRNTNKKRIQDTEILVLGAAAGVNDFGSDHVFRREQYQEGMWW